MMKIKTISEINKYEALDGVSIQRIVFDLARTVNLLLRSNENIKSDQLSFEDCHDVLKLIRDVDTKKHPVAFKLHKMACQVITREE